jgi:hypothetical protein
MTSFAKWAPLKLIIGFSIAKIDNYRVDRQTKFATEPGITLLHIIGFKYVQLFLLHALPQVQISHPRTANT